MGSGSVCTCDLLFTPRLQPGDRTLLIRTGNRFNGLLFRYVVIRLETVETVRLYRVVFPSPG